MGHIENIYRGRTAADWFVLRSERASNSHILGESMRYLCLVYGSEDSLPVMQNPKLMSGAEVDALTQDSLAYNDVLRTSGHFILAHALQSVRTATTLRVRGGQVLVTDGPFAETKEQLLGFVLIDAKDDDDAVAVASKIPLARLGSIEVRPTKDLASQS